MAGTFNIADLFESLVRAIPGRTALVSGAHRLTFAQLDERADRLADVLRGRGVGPRDHVGLHLYNGHPFVEAMIACFKLRAVPINLNYRYVAAELRPLCVDADLVGIVTQRELLPVVAEAARGTGAAATVLALDDGSGVTVPGLEARDYEQALAAATPRQDYGPRSGDDLWVIYTGGTTGKPKGVMWRHEDIFFAGLQGGRPGGDPVTSPEEVVAHASDPDNAMRLLPAAPFIHGAAQLGAWISMFTGGPLVLQPGRSFDAKRCVELIGEEQLTTITLVGDAMARPIADVLAAGTYDTSSLLAVASAGAILSPAVRDRLQELLPDALILNNFGSTETGHQGSAYPGSETGADGRPSFAMDEHSLVLDDDLQPIAPGSGTLGKLARGGHIPLGYYKDEAKTAERFVTIGGKRFALPGDMATVEGDGRITVYGRGSNCINTGGEKVFPEEVEEALKAHPDVFDALVVGVADDRWMQRVAAVVQPRAGARPDLATLQAHCRTLIAGYKVPRQVSLVAAVERYPSGKPDYAWAKSIAEKEMVS
ncbi:MAG: acyl-CoA synthetase [Kofleriaceae bacterium]|nr:MAG: acyl-CoA synthetase [Kofleriaceae bacterium]MBZ0231266.1 acyl-CoA synthetase [Kofleriaceae bacterium]